MVPRELGEAGRMLPLSPWRECVGPADTLVLDFWPPAPGENKSLMFQASRFVGLCYSSHGELIHPVTL